MVLCKWEDLPEKLQNEKVKKYYDILSKKKVQLVFKRLFDIIVALLLLIILSPLYLLLAIVIKIDSKGPVFYRQVRITQYGKEFRIHKFRSMIDGADKNGELVTLYEDERITKVGRFIRKFRLDEISQLIDIIEGNMTFVGVRPEVPRFVDEYTDEMMATLLLPSGVTSLTSIYFASESLMLKDSEDVDSTYINEILPEKMKWNLKGIENSSFFGDIKLMFMTFFAMLGKNYSYCENDDVIEEKV